MVAKTLYLTLAGSCVVNLIDKCVARTCPSLHLQASDIIISSNCGSSGSIEKRGAGEERKQEKLAERRHFLGGHYHLFPSGVASLYKFLYVLDFSITKRTRSTDTTARTLDRGGDRDARKSLEGGGVCSFVVSSVGRFVRSFVRSSIRPSVHPLFRSVVLAL